jgi:hypothetical protein
MKKSASGSPPMKELKIEQVISVAPELNSLEQFIGIWADLTEEEETLFVELLSSRHVDFERPLLDLFAE